ncbi:MAG: MarR family winged helix-turn-helix transcriptional regulator [Dehalococcoidia bacterium]
MTNQGDPPPIAALLRVPYHAAMTHVRRRLTVELPDLRPAHLAVLQHLALPPAGPRLTDLAERSQITVQSMGELIDTLEIHGYVERIPDQADRRAKRIRSTDRGSAAHVRGREIMLELHDAWAGQLGVLRFEQLLVLLRDLGESLRAGTNDT